MAHADLDATAGGTVRVERWPTELPLFALVALAAVGIWVLLIVSIVGAVYAALIGIFLFVTHVTYVAHLRGSAVRLGPDQFPELHQRVQELARRAGLSRVPDAYLLQAGGALNALATKFFGSRFIVLYSDLLEACGENQKARDMIIGHELGHIKAGHLNLMWFLVPGFFVPFLGTACSRAREYTCDRYGLALCGDPGGALAGLAILAAGREHGPRVNVQALAHQRAQMNTGWMTLGKWLGTHPPLCDRVAALEPALAAGLGSLVRGPLRASLGLALFLLAWIVGVGWLIVRTLPEFRKGFEQATARQQRRAVAPPQPALQSDSDPETVKMTGTVKGHLEALAKAAEDFQHANGRYPATADALYGFWKRSITGSPEPIDPFTEERYHYEPAGDQFLLWSVGPDGISGTKDDIHFFGGAKVASP